MAAAAIVVERWTRERSPLSSLLSLTSPPLYLSLRPDDCPLRSIVIPLLLQFNSLLHLEFQLACVLRRAVAIVAGQLGSWANLEAFSIAATQFG